MRKVIYAILGLVALLLLYLLFWPVAIDPVAWTAPQAPPLEGIYEQNSRLAGVERLGEGAGVAPEDVAFDSEGRMYGGMEDGRIVRFQPDGSQPEEFAVTGGRPLGLDFDAADNLIIADAYKGLLSVSPDRAITVLSDGYAGVPFVFTNDVDVAADGTIYFSEASSKFPLDTYISDILEQRPNGSLLAYDPASGETRLIRDDLYFANGVAVSPDQSFLLISETARMRVRRYWLTGPRAGQDEIIIENLPGFPDNISSNGEGVFWLALVSPRQPDVEATLPYPFLRRMIMRLPPALLPAPEDFGLVLGLDGDGNVLYNLQDPEAAFTQISGVTEHEGMLYLGSLYEDAIGLIPVP